MATTDLRHRSNRRQFLKSAGGIVTAGVLAGCADDSGGDGEEKNIIEMNDDLKFVPDTFEVTVGEAVTWENVGSVGHSVTAYEDEIPEEAEYFASGDLDSESAARDTYPDEGDIPGGETYEHTFDTESEYQYFCIPHEQAGMKGMITVQ